MIDMTNAIREANQGRAAWTKELFRAALQQFAGIIPEPTVDWDEGVPEQWGKIWSKHGRMAVMVCLPLPLVIATEEARAQLETQMRFLGLTVITASDWDKRLFSVDPEALCHAFNLHHISEALNPQAFSIDELWYATVTA